MLTIKPLQPDDWRIWRELRLLALAEAPQSFGATLAEWQGSGDIEARWRGRLINVPYNAVAQLDGQLAGMVGATAPTDAQPVELLSLWVAPWARGRGVGDALVQAVLDWATARRAEAVMLRVLADNVRAIALYQRHNFVDTGRSEPWPDGRHEKLLRRLL